MRNKILFMLFVFGGLSTVFGQSRDTTKLKNDVANYLVRDTHRVNLILDYFYYYVEHKNNHNKIDPLLLEGLEISREKKYELGTGRLLTILGPKYYQNAQKEKALTVTLESIQILKKLKANEDLLIAYTNLSELYLSTGQPEKALEMNMASVQIVKKQKAELAHGRIYYYTAQTFEKTKDFKNAEKYYLEAKENAKKFNFTIGVAISNSALAEVYSKQGQYQKALPLFKSTIEFAREHNQLPNLASSLSHLGDLYVKLEDYSQSILSYSEAIRIYESINNSNVLASLYASRAESYERKGENGSAIRDLKRSKQIADSMFTVDKNSLTEELMTKYETEKIKKEAKLAKQDKELADFKVNQSMYISIGVGIFALVTIVLLAILLSRLKVIRSQKKKLNESILIIQKKTDQDLTNSRLLTLKSQMNPHFIFNSLNSIQDLILQEDTETSYDYMVLFSELVRSILNYSNDEFIAIEDEVELLSKYLELEKLRFEDEFDYSIIQNDINGINIPTFMIQPFIENSIVHGLLHKEGRKVLTIEFKKGEQLTCTITDNGVGLTKSTEINKRRGGNHTSFAIKNIENRLELLNKKYTSNFDYEISELFENDFSKGTQVVLTLPHVDLS